MFNPDQPNRLIAKEYNIRIEDLQKTKPIKPME